MTWRDQLQQGKFRSAKFFTDSHGAAGGRRLALHEYPLRDRPYAEDLGRKNREFSLECYVLGDDYMSARDDLIEALEKQGPGVLVHPYLGSRNVSVREYRLTESTVEGGMARFSITFVESGRPIEPDASLDTSETVNSGACSAIKSINDDFARVFGVSGLPGFVRQAAISVVDAGLDAILSAASTVVAVQTQASGFVADLTAAKGSLSSLVDQPSQLAGQVTGLIGSIASVAGTPRSAILALRLLFDHGYTTSDVPGSTPSRLAQAANQAAVHAMIRRAAIIEAARAASSATFESHADAVAVRDELSDRMDTEMETAADDVYAALTDLRAAMVRDINTRGAMLPRIVTWTPAATLPALALAHRIYGDATREQDILARNRIRHPGFVPGGTALEVLSDA